jgi:hypothetical protein
VVASFREYRDAKQAVDYLASRRFPVEQVAIVAGDLRFVEQVTGRRGYFEAAVDGATSGAITGAVLGFILGLFTLITPVTSGLVLALWGAVVGAVIGALAGTVAHAFLLGRRRFRSVRALDAGRYDVVAAAAVAERTRDLLDEAPVRAA